MFHSPHSALVIDQNAPHFVGGCGKKVAWVVPLPTVSF
jgi:hypothetical protein